MRALGIGLGSVLALGILPIFSWAEVQCGPYIIIEVESPQELENYTNCTTILGDLSVYYTFGGQFTLPNLINITGKIDATSLSDGWTVTSIQFPELLSAQAIKIDTSNVTNISLPKLKKVDQGISISQHQMATALDFRSLTHAGSVTLDGVYTSFNFDSLRNVDYDLNLKNCKECYYRYLENGVSNISFPSLESAGYISLGGEIISSLSMPELVSAGPPKPEGGEYQSTGSGLMLNIENGNLAVNFPKLSSVDSTIKVDGNFSSLSMPSLRYTNASISISPSEPATINLSLVSAAQLNISGKIESLEFPALANFTSLDVKTTNKFDCRSFIKSIKGTSNYTGDGSNLQCHDNIYRKPNLDREGKILIGTFIPLGVILAVIFFVIRRRSRRKNPDPSPVALTFLRPRVPRQLAVVRRESTPEPPPPYSPREES